MAATATETSAQTRVGLPSAAREAMEELNAEAGELHIWLRTQANAPSQRPWFKDGGIDVGGGRVGANQMKAAPHRWRWREIGPYLDRIAEIARNADVSPIEFADRQQFLLSNPASAEGSKSRLRSAARYRSTCPATLRRCISTRPMPAAQSSPKTAAIPRSKANAARPHAGI